MSNPNVKKSFQKDKRRILLLKSAAKLFRQKKLAASMGKAAIGLDKIQQTSFFSHNEYNFHSQDTITAAHPSFDFTDYMDTVHQGVFHHLLSQKKTRFCRPSGQKVASSLSMDSNEVTDVTSDSGLCSQRASEDEIGV